MSQIKNIIFLFSFLLLTNILKADGPPIDTSGKIHVPYISITLTKLQAEHLQKNRHLDLTAEQQKKLARWKLPNTIDILDPYWRDCTCGMIYGIWYKPNEVAFLLRDTIKTNCEKGSANDETNEYYKNYQKEDAKTNLYIGTDGRIYYQNKLISFQEISKIIEEIKAIDKDNPYLIIYQPPKTGNTYWSNVEETKKKIEKIIPAGFSYHWM